MSEKIVIWGSGIIGSVAYYYYKNWGEIICYVDNDSRKWGEKLNGIEICSPQILKNADLTVVLAVKRGINDIRRQLRMEYGIKRFILFQITQQTFDEADNLYEIPENTCIVLFSGGLGNQMFQYSFSRYLESQGKNVVAEKDPNSVMEKFLLKDIFKNITLKVCTAEQETNLINKNLKTGLKAQRFLLYTEESINEVNEKEAYLNTSDITGGIFSGLFQTYKYAKQIRNVLLKDFEFRIKDEKKLNKVSDNIMKANSVAVHIRRGDYLKGNNRWLYGDICTQEYYSMAMMYLKEKVEDCNFVFFSNDIEWVKEQYKVVGATYIEKAMFDDYKDWYDMYLMSICKHNIIANSTFSWWGAWLNQNEDKIVIAPKKWINLCNYKDIYPEEWLRI